VIEDVLAFWFEQPAKTTAEYGRKIRRWYMAARRSTPRFATGSDRSSSARSPASSRTGSRSRAVGSR